MDSIRIKLNWLVNMKIDGIVYLSHSSMLSKGTYGYKIWIVGAYKDVKYFSTNYVENS